MSELRTLVDIPNTNNPESLALGVAEGRRLNYHDLRQEVEEVASFLRYKGVKAGDVIASVLGNDILYVVTFLATTQARAVAAPLNPAYREEEFKFYLEDSGAKVVILSSTSPAAAKAAAKALNVVVWNVKESRGFVTLEGSSIGETVEKTEVSPDDVALFLHTSGTTSRPKGVPLTHKNLVTTIKNIINTYDLVPSDRNLLVMPLFHVHGLMAGLLSTLGSGGAVIFPPGGKFSASTFWKFASQFRITWYTAVPTIHQVLLLRADTDYPKENAPPLRFIRSCSASLAPSILEGLETKFKAPVLEAYAMTEAAHQMTSNPLPSRGPHKPGSVGIGQNVRVTILDDKNQEVPVGTVGEVCIQGDNVTKGYLNNPKANEEAFAGGWFHTGDQGFLDADGYVTLTGRIKELINRGGEKISPLEVDAVLLSLPGVAEAVSFAAPDWKYGEEVNAAIVLKDGETTTDEDIIKLAKEKLADFKVPKKVFITKELPRTATGKIQRRIVASHFVTEEKKKEPETEAPKTN